MERYALPRNSIVDRTEMVVARCAGLRVLHVGCADAPYFRSQHAAGRLLHARLARVAGSVVGIDLDHAGISFLRDLGFQEVHRASVEDLSCLEPTDPFDVIVAGEVLEHLPNPGLALTQLSRYLQPHGRLLITVPNAFSIKSILRALVGVELVHPDHFYYFSVTTMKRLLMSSELEVTYVGYYHSKPAGSGARLFDQVVLGALRYAAPWLSEGLIIEAQRPARKLV